MHSLALVGAVDPVLLELVGLSLHGEDALVLVASLRSDLGDEGVVRLTALTDPGAEPTTLDLARPVECWTCSLREIIVSLAEDRAAWEPDGATVILLPPGVEAVHLLPGLMRDVADLPGVRLAGVAHVIDVDTAADNLLDHHPLPACDAAVFGDDLCTGEVHMVGIGYADVVVALGQDPVGRDLVEHLRAHDTLLLPGMDAPLLSELLAVTHDVDAAMARVHPATTQAWGGPHDHGVRTLDLFSHMPFHPGRLRELVSDLAGRGMLTRGCFWLPSRPGRVCTWEVAGGVVSVGDAGTWEEPHCHLVVTGIGDDAACERVRAAFRTILLRPDEMVEALAWAGAPDGLEDWFGQD